MVNTRSQSKKDTAAEVPAMDQAHANLSTPQSPPDVASQHNTAVAGAVTAAYLGSATTMTTGTSNDNANDNSLSTSGLPGIPQVNVVALNVQVSDQQVTVTTQVSSGIPGSTVHPVQSVPHIAPAVEEEDKGSGKKRKQGDTASDATVTKQLKVSKTKAVKVNKEEDNDNLELREVPSTSVTTSVRRESLRKRGTDGTTSACIQAAGAAPHGHHMSFITLKMCPGYTDKITAGTSVVVALKKAKRKPRPRRKTPYTNRYKFEFGEDRLPGHVSPTPEQLAEVMNILGQERMSTTNAGKDKPASSTPMHAGCGISVDSIVRVIVSQSCTNEMALDAQATMRLAYPYMVNGEMVVGAKPNYHAMRVQTVDKLKRVLKKAGLQNLKAPKIKECLDVVYAKNVAMLQPGEVIYEGNDPTAQDFVPGLLSMDYLWEIYEQHGKQAVFDHLVLLPQIGVKSACCLMGFNMGLPVFAVDTHVAGMAKLLG